VRATELLEDDRVAELLVEEIADEETTAGLNLYRLRPLGPPQYSSLSAEQSMLQRPSVTGPEAELTPFEQ